MVAHIASLMRLTHAHNDVQQAKQKRQENADAPAPRHEEGALLKTAEKVGAVTGEGLFQASFAVGAAGYLFRNTIGRINKNWGANVGRYTVAPFEALDATSLHQLWHNPNALKANYFTRAANYVQEHKGDAGKLLAKAEELGGAQLAHANWQGIGKIGNYLMHRGAYGTIMGAGLALAGGVAVARSSKHAVDSFHDLQAVAKDLTGQEISFKQFMNAPETLPRILLDMRGNLMDHIKTEMSGSVGKLVEQSALAAMGGPMAHAAGAAGSIFGIETAGMMAGMMVQQAAQQLAPSQDFVKSYLEVTDLQKAHQPVPEDIYTKLLAASSAEVRRIGPDSEQVQRIVKQYAEEGISPKAMVHEIYAVEPFKARASKIYEQMQKEEEAAPAEEMNAAKPEIASLAQAAHQGKIHTPHTHEMHGGRV